QKPARPLWFGRKEHSLVFALPGNSASFVTCLQVYVLPLLRSISSGKQFDLQLKHGILNGDVENPGGKSLFLLAMEEDGVVRILGKQACNTLGAFATANALVYVDEVVRSLALGDRVRCLRINNSACC